MNKLRMARWVGGVALVALLAGCGVEEPAPEGSAAEQVSPWLDVDTGAVQRGRGVPALAHPETLAGLHQRTEQAFVNIMMAAGPQRMIRFETQHGNIPNQGRWGGDTRYHFEELDGRMSNTTAWEMTNLQLVGLIKNPQGAVYQIPAQANVPLAKLKDFPTRNLDEFEHTALKQLQDGKNAIAYVENDRVRLLGAIRMTADCTACHKEAQGTLLGAFTYDLKRDANPYKKPAPPAPVPGAVPPPPNAPVLP